MRSKKLHIASLKSAEHSAAQGLALSKPIWCNLIPANLYSLQQIVTLVLLRFIKDCMPLITAAVSVQTHPTADIDSECNLQQLTREQWVSV